MAIEQLTSDVRGGFGDRWRLPERAAFYVIASVVVLFLASSSAPTPLYRTYQAEWGFSAITTTMVFAIYALAVLIALLVLGRLSDHVGRRPVLLAAVSLQAAAMLIFATAGGVTELMVARVIQGIATGAAAGAVGAALLDLDKGRGTFANAIAAPIGTALGAVVAGILVQYLPAPTHLIYVVLFALFLAQAAGLGLIAETGDPRPGALASMRPDVSVPDAARPPLLAAIPVLLAVWSLGGLYASLGPALVRVVSGSGSFLLGALALSVLTGTGAITIVLTRSTHPATLMVAAGSALALGAAVTLVSVNASSTIGFFVGAVIAGAGFGVGFQGAVRTVLPHADAHRRSGVLSVIYIVSYLALGGPAVAAGYLAVQDGLLTTARIYGVAVIVLGLLTLAPLVRPRRTRRAQPQRALRPCGEVPCGPAD